MPAPAPAPLEFDAARLDAYLRSGLPGRAAGPMTLERISGGQSNPTFFLSYPEAGTRLVLRKKATGAAAALGPCGRSRIPDSQDAGGLGRPGAARIAVRGG